MKSVFKLILINVAVFLSILLLANLIAAALLDVDFKRDVFRDPRAQLPSYTDHDRAALILGEFHQLQTRYEPFVVWTRRPFRGETTTVNEDGDRVHPPTTEHPTAVVRFFGGSTVWGTGVDDAHTIPALFNAHFPTLAVHNHGESAFHSRHEVARLVNLVSQQQPMDLVVFYDGYNDAMNLCRHGVPPTGSHRAAQIDRRVNPGSHLGQALTGAIRELLLGSFFSRVVFRTHEQPNPCVADPQHARVVADTLIENWRSARVLARRRGAEFMAVLQPVAAEGRSRIDYLDAGEYEQPALSLIYARVRERAAAERIAWFHDFTDVYDGPEPIYIDASHANARGHERVAARLAAIAAPHLTAP